MCSKLGMESDLEVESYQDIFCDEQEYQDCEEMCNPDSIQCEMPQTSTTSATAASTGTGARKKHTLNKKKREQVIKALNAINSTDLLDMVVTQLSNELHMRHYCEREELFTSLLDSSTEELKSICSSLAATFVEIYRKCEKGKEKYGRFQVEWHQSCSIFMLDGSTSEAIASKCSSAELWSRITKSTPRDVRNPVMIAIVSSVYNYMMKSAKLAINEPDTIAPPKVESEPEEVYLRFAGAALADMFTLRYKAMKSDKSFHSKEMIQGELQVLEWMRMTDKSKLPSSLQYRDKGGMYFPDKELLQFIKCLDDCVRENANEEAYKRYGKSLVKISTEQIAHNQLLFEKFTTFIQSKVEGADITDTAITSVYTEFSRKLCNTRLNEFLDAHRQRGKTTLAGQNLRDTLLTHHVNKAD